MIITTTPSIDGKKTIEYKGVVTGETILGANFLKDIFASFTDFFGGRSGAYEKSLKEARETAISEMKEEAKRFGANAIIGVDIDYESISRDGSSMLMVTCSGTAVVLEDSRN